MDEIGCEETTISDDDTKLPTSGAVVDYVSTQLAAVGGFETIATDAVFPNSQPASGIIVSVADAGGLVVNGSGQSTTGRTVGGSTVTINNINSQFNSTTVAAGVGMLVTSTGSGQIYNYHKATLKEADLINLSTDINDFGNRYRVNAGEPSSNNDEGDLVYDTNADKMKVYDSSTSAWKEVTSSGDFKYLFLCPAGGSGAPTLNGSIATYDLRESSNSGSAASVTSAAQLLVSINGVVQKANTGTSAPAEGFALVDSNTIIFGANLASGDSVFIVQIGSAITISTPGDGTVTAAKIASGAVETAKIADDAVTEGKLGISNAGSNGQFLSKQSGNTGGLTWATVSTDLVSDTSPQLGAELDTNGNDIKLTDGERLLLWNHGSLGTKTGATNAVVSGLTGYVLQNSTILDGDAFDIWLSTTGKKITFGTSDSTTHEVMRVQCAAVGASQHGFVNLNYVTANAGSNASSATKLQTTSTGITVTGTVAATSYTGDGSNLTGIASTVAGGAIYENSQTISADHTIPVGSKGMSAGPVTVNNGISLTISNGSTYTIV